MHMCLLTRLYSIHLYIDSGIYVHVEVMILVYAWPFIMAAVNSPEMWFVVVTVHNVQWSDQMNTFHLNN